MHDVHLLAAEPRQLQQAVVMVNLMRTIKSKIFLPNTLVLKLRNICEH